MVKISHLVKNYDQDFDGFFLEKFNEHIIEKFCLTDNELKAELSVNNSGQDYTLTLNYHYHKQHYHLHAHDRDIFKAGTKIVAELEKIVRRKKKERLERRKKISKFDFAHVS